MTDLATDYRFTGDPPLKCAGCGRAYLEPSGFGSYCSDRCLWKTVSSKKPSPRRTSTRPRDTQRAKVYAAERKAFPRFDVQEFPKIADCQVWLDGVLASRWFQSRWGRRQVEVRFKAHGTASGSPLGRICLPPWARNPWVILHELGHVLGPLVEPWHGPGYCATYLELIRGHFGEEEARKLREAFTAGGVKYRAGVAAVPKAGTRKVVTKAEQAAKKKESDNRPVTLQEAQRTAEVLRRGVRLGHFGAAGTKERAAVLVAARKLEAMARGG